MATDIWIDDEVKGRLETAAKVAGFSGITRFNAVIRRLLEIPDHQEHVNGTSISLQPSLPRDRVRWFALHEILDSKIFEHRTKPSEVRLPDGSTKSIQHWADVMEELAKWLFENGKVVGDLPTTGGPRVRPLITRNKSKITHTEVAREFAPGWWLDTWGSVYTKAKRIRRLLLDTGVDPSSLAVSVEHTYLY